MHTHKPLISALLLALAGLLAPAPALAAGLDEHVGVVLLTEEALRSGADALRAALLRQQDWSDIPFVVLAAARWVVGY